MTAPSQAHIPAWVYRYLQRLGESVDTPSYEYLSRLMTAHLSHFAFENISKLYYYQQFQQTGWYVPPIEGFVENMHTLDVGGTCFTCNSNFVRLLQELGFEAHLVGFNMAHMGIIVHLSQGLFYVDVGVGAPFFQPVDFQTDPFVEYCGSGIRIEKKADEPDTYHFHHYNLGNNVLQWELYTKPARPFEHFAEYIQKQHTPGTMFMQMIRCQLWQPDQHRNVMLSNNSLTIRYEDRSERKYTLHSVKEIKDALANEFRLPRLPIDEAVEVLESLGVDIFGSREEK